MKNKWRDSIKNFIDKIDGGDQYKKYLKHFYKNHKNQTALSKKQFFAKKEIDKWSKINRCC